MFEFATRQPMRATATQIRVSMAGPVMPPTVRQPALYYLSHHFAFRVVLDLTRTGLVRSSETDSLHYSKGWPLLGSTRPWLRPLRASLIQKSMHSYQARVVRVVSIGRHSCQPGLRSEGERAHLTLVCLHRGFLQAIAGRLEVQLNGCMHNSALLSVSL